MYHMVNFLLGLPSPGLDSQSHLSHRALSTHSIFRKLPTTDAWPTLDQMMWFSALGAILILSEHHSGQEGLNSIAQYICWFTFMVNCFLYEPSARTSLCSTNKATRSLFHAPLLCFSLVFFWPLRVSLTFGDVQSHPWNVSYHISSSVWDILKLEEFVILLNTITRNVISPTKNVNMPYVIESGSGYWPLESHKEARLVGKETFLYCGGWTWGGDSLLIISGQEL